MGWLEVLLRQIFLKFAKGEIMEGLKSLDCFVTEKISIEASSKRSAIGYLGEEIAKVYFERIGWQLVERNWKLYRSAELDLILRSPSNTLVFLEVKTRTYCDSIEGNFEACLAAIDKKKQKQIQKAAMNYISRAKSYTMLRFDVLAVCLQSQAIVELSKEKIFAICPESVHVLHIADAF